MVMMACGDWRAEIAPECGGNVVRLTCRGKDVWRNREQQANPCLVGAPILLPANRTAEGRFVFEGKAYQLPVNEPASGAHLHGLVYGQTFQVEAQGADRACLVYRSTPDVYPFPVEIKVAYTLTASGLRTDYQVTNQGPGAMPLTFGLHTTFVEPDFFSVPIGEEQERDARNLPTGRYVPLNDQQKAYAAGMDPRRAKISGYFSASGHEARVGEYRYRVCPAFDHWILYNGGGGSGQLCVEPQMGGVNGLNLPGGCRVLQMGETLRLWTEVSLAEFERQE